jgi:hypothetical protein
MCGPYALDYVRYRHTDNDIVRSARQQDFLRQIKQQIGVSKLIDKRDELIHIFGQFTQSDIGSRTGVLRLLSLVVGSASHPIHEIHFSANLGPSYVTASSKEVHKLAQEFLGVTAPAAPAQPAQGGGHRSRRSRRLSRAGLADMSSMGKQMALQLVSNGARGLRLYYPRLLPNGATFLAPSRAYTDKAAVTRRSFNAYRIVISTGKVGEYLGFQGLSWTNPPILANPSAIVTLGHRQYQLYRDGDRTRLVAWRSDGAVYWVSNTLSETVSERQLIAIARSARPLG